MEQQLSDNPWLSLAGFLGWREATRLHPPCPSSKIIRSNSESRVSLSHGVHLVGRAMTQEPRFKQEPITRGEQLPCLVSRRFHKTVYFYNNFGANFEYLFGATNHSAKPKDLKMILLNF